MTFFATENKCVNTQKFSVHISLINNILFFSTEKKCVNTQKFSVEIRRRKLRSFIKNLDKDTAISWHLLVYLHKH